MDLSLADIGRITALGEVPGIFTLLCPLIRNKGLYLKFYFLVLIIFQQYRPKRILISVSESGTLNLVNVRITKPNHILKVIPVRQFRPFTFNYATVSLWYDTDDFVQRIEIFL